MKIRHKLIFEATQYNKRGDHRWEYVWSNATPILDEKPGEENRWPATGHLATLDECNPKDLRYSVQTSENPSPKNLQGEDFFYVNITDWILELNGKVVAVISNERYKNNYEIIE